MRILDSKPQVGIFEIVDGVLLIDTEDVQKIDQGGGMFDGVTPHLHSNDIKTLVINSPSISEEIKQRFNDNPSEYLNYPRGRVDYDIVNDRYYIMAAMEFFNSENVERITRAFHLPPYSTGKILLQADNSHYGY